MRQPATDNGNGIRKDVSCIVTEDAEFINKYIREGREKIDPDMAKLILTYASYQHQRPVSKSHVDLLANSMSRDQWTEASQISFGRLNGKLYNVNGQHRLHAVIKSKKEQEFQINIHDVSSEQDLSVLYYRFDTEGRVRSLPEILNATGIKKSSGLNNTVIQALYKAAPFIDNNFQRIAYQNDPIRARSIDYRLEHTHKWLDTAKMFNEWVSGGTHVFRNKIFRFGSFAVGLVTAKYCPAEAEKFWVGLAEQAGLAKSDPRLTYYRDLETRFLQATAQNQGAKACANAWNAFYDKKKIAHIKVLESAKIIIKGTPWGK